MVSLMKKCILICNLESGRGIKKQELDKIIAKIETFSYEVTLFITNNQGDATKYVEKIDDASLVLSIGGDGTFNMWQK